MSYNFYIKKTEQGKDLALPNYMTDGASGIDLMACLSKDVTLKRFERVLIPTGIHIEMPVGFEAQIRPRSGLALNFGITLLNTPGTIDSDYRGEIKVIVINLGSDDFIIKHGDRIAQMVIAKYTRVNFIEVCELSDTKRGEKGFGHTNIN